MDLSYLTKFNSLSQNIKSAASAPEAVARISELSAEYKIDLAATIMRVMTRDIKLDALGAYLINVLQLPAEQARSLEQKLRRGIFAPVIDYLLGADKGPKLVFHEADEKDARAAITPTVNSTAAADFDKEIDASVETIVAQSRIHFSDPLSGGKFRQVMKTYLRGTRDKLAVNDTLIKAAELGGVALSRDTAERVLIIASNFLHKQAPVAPQAKIILPDEPRLAPLVPATAAATAAQPVRHAEYDLEASLRDQGKITEIKKVAQKAKGMEKAQKPDIFKPINLDASHELMPPVPALIPPAVPAAAASLSAAAATTVTAATSAAGVTTAAKNIRETTDPVIGNTATVTPPRRRLFKQMLAGKPLDKTGLRQLAAVDNTLKSANGKVRMDDIRFTTAAQSPIDELKNFNLVNFRRLDPDPLKATAKIREKMEVLGREEYAQKIAAIVAWQQSPLNRLYLSVCRRSLDEGLALGAVLDRERKNEPNFLRSDELSAIISLNRSLKF